MRKTKASQIALGGMLTAVAVVIMAMGSLIPLNTYVCPVLCILITRLIISTCGKRIGWCYYGAVSILSLLLAPDREAALVYVFLGYYPMIRHWFDRIRHRPVQLVLKTVLFTLAGCGVYGLLMFVLGMNELLAEFRQMGAVLTVIMVAVWDLLFLMVDRLLSMPLRKRRK